MIRLVTVAIAALLLIPAAAQAGGRVEVQGDKLVYTGTVGNDAVGFFLIGSDISVERVMSADVGTGDPEGGGPTEAGPGCEFRDVYGQRRVICAGAGITGIVASYGAGDDRAVSQAGGLPIEVDAGDGDDLVDIAQSGTYDLGDGNDRVRAAKKSARYTVLGGEGNDDLLCSNKSYTDGLTAGNVLNGGSGKDRICSGRGDDRISGGAGNDKVYAGDGDDRINGGAGDDLLRGEDDADTITGGTGEDEIEAGAGKDTIRVKDRGIDDVDGGSGRDSVVADKSDDLTRCETVRRS